MTSRFTDLEDPRWLALFSDLAESWFRLETLQVYAVNYEAQEFEEFLRTGELPSTEGDWKRMIARHASSGRRLQRVHIIEEPLTDYVRYELAAYRQNAAAGEEIRLIPTRSGTWPSGLPEREDFWILDDRAAWAMRYDPQGRFVAAEEVTDPDRLRLYRAWREVAMEASIPLADYARDAA